MGPYLLDLKKKTTTKKPPTFSNACFYCLFLDFYNIFIRLNPQILGLVLLYLKKLSQKLTFDKMYKNHVD